MTLTKHKWVWDETKTRRINLAHISFLGVTSNLLNRSSAIQTVSVQVRAHFPGEKADWVVLFICSSKVEAQDFVDSLTQN